MKIGITGSIASGKTTVAKVIANKKNPLFSADDNVKSLYKDKHFKSRIIKKFSLAKSKNIKNQLKRLIVKDKQNLKELEKFIHPYVRKKMFEFIKKNIKKKLIVFEIPLLIESKLMKYFDKIVFVGAKRETRLKRYIKKGGNKSFFSLLENRQLSPSKKSKYCDYKIVNNKNINILNKKIKYIINNI
tara:strand:- start:554 stop:1114 length:561 start_codon:yes stop_codon:yes gene_type:complete